MSRVSSNQEIKETLLKKLRPSDFMDYRHYLKSIYQSLKNKLEHYSYKELSADLGLGPTTLAHQIVQGYRPLTRKTAEKICQALGLNSEETEYLMQLIRYQNSKKLSERQESFQRLLNIKANLLPSVLDRDLMSYFSEWYHPIVRELVLLEDFVADPAWIAEQLDPPIDVEEARESLDLLERLEFIRYDRENNRFVQSDGRVSSGHAVEGLGLMKYHQQMLERSQSALLNQSAEMRDISALTIAADAETLSELKAKIHQLQIEALDRSEKIEKPDRVYQINVQLFPLSKLPDGEKS